jgi:hypothetical protein
VLGQDAVHDGVVHQAAGDVALADRAAGPVDHLRCQYAPDAEFLAEAEEERVDADTVDFRQLSEIADAHHHLGVGVTASDFEVAAEAGGEAERDRLQDGVDAKRDAGAGEVVDRCVEAFERDWDVGRDDDFDAPVDRGLAIGAVDAEDELGARRRGGSDLAGVEAVDGDAVTGVAERADRVADAEPGAVGLAAHVDEVGAIALERRGLLEDFGE